MAIQKQELPEGSAEALLDPNFLLTKDPLVEEISSLLALVSECASDGYHLLSEAESFHNEAYSKLPLVSSSASVGLLQANLSIPQESALQHSTSGYKHQSSPDVAQLIPSSKIHCVSVSMEGLRIPEDFPWAWLPTLEPEYVGLEAKHYYQCFEGCSFSNYGKAVV